MTGTNKNAAAAWVAILVIALGLASHLHDDYRYQAQRLDLKIMTLEITKNTDVIPRMNLWRNDSRRRAEVLEISVLLISISAGLAAITLAVSGVAFVVLNLISVITAVAALYFAVTALI